MIRHLLTTLALAIIAPDPAPTVSWLDSRDFGRRGSVPRGRV